MNKPMPSISREGARVVVAGFRFDGPVRIAHDGVTIRDCTFVGRAVEAES